MARPYLGGSTGGIKEISSATTLSLADSGKTILLSEGSAPYTVTLPAVTNKGWEATFILVSNSMASANSITVASPSANQMKVMKMPDENSAGNIDLDADAIVFPHSLTNVLSKATVVSDGSFFITHVTARDFSYVDITN